MNKNIIYIAVALATSVSYSVCAKDIKKNTQPSQVKEEPSFFNEEVDFSVFKGVYAGVGGGMNFGRNVTSTVIESGATPVGHSTNQDKRLGIHRLMGSLVFGGGKTFKNKHNVSLEVMADFSKASSFYGAAEDGYQNTTTSLSPIGYTELKIRNNGIVPTLAIRYGYVANPKFMFYWKVGARYNKIIAEWEADDTNNRNNFRHIKLSKITPVLGAGVETAIWKVIGRLDVDFKFHRQKSVPCLAGNDSNAISSKLKDDTGFNIRLMACCNFNVD